MARVTVEAEIRYVIRRLARHPCIVFWSGCNECGGGAGDITTFVLPIVAAEDKTRPVWPAAPVRQLPVPTAAQNHLTADIAVTDVCVGAYRHTSVGSRASTPSPASQMETHSHLAGRQ